MNGALHNLNRLSVGPRHRSRHSDWREPMAFASSYESIEGALLHHQQLLKQPWFAKPR